MKVSIVLYLLVLVLPFSFAQLKVGFYESSCPKAESIIREEVEKRFKSDNNITAALLRLHFHDCFVQGCDASILIDSTGDNKAEKDARPNRSVRGYDLIGDVKERLEEECPSTVSCADIITVATRDAVALAGGPQYEVPTGRRDGLVSLRSKVHFPLPSISVPEALEFFDKKGIKRVDMVSLMGGHTVGFVARSSSLDSTPFVVDNVFYNDILQHKAIFTLDGALAFDPSTRDIVNRFAQDNEAFKKSFEEAMIKMGNIEVLVGEAGEIRRKCNVTSS